MGAAVSRLVLVPVVLAGWVMASALWGSVWAVATAIRAMPDHRDCRLQAAPRRVRVSVSKYPENWRHMVDARHGRNTGPDGVHTFRGDPWPTVLVLNRRGATERREAGERLSGLEPRAGKARDEYPPAFGRSTNAADFRYVNRRKNSAQGTSMGNQLRAYCDGQKFRLVATR